MEKTMDISIIGYIIGTTIRIHSFIPSYPKVSLRAVLSCKNIKSVGSV